jgi:glycerol uptake facilitator-like aquaporin
LFSSIDHQSTTMPAITILSSIYQKLAPFVPPGLATSIAASYVGEGKYFKVWRDEFIGTLLMIGFTFSPGKWIGQDSLAVAWTAHACGVVAADKIGGGQHVNPAVTCSMYALGKCSYTEAFVRIMGAMGGGLVAFPLFKLFAETFSLTPLGGPEFDPTGDEEGTHAAFSEAVAVVLLLILIYAVNWELNFGKYHYWIKQTLTALGIRYIIETFPRAGPSINPMLATTWYIFKTGNYPDHFGHCEYTIFCLVLFLNQLPNSYLNLNNQPIFFLHRLCILDRTLCRSHLCKRLVRYLCWWILVW